MTRQRFASWCNVAAAALATQAGGAACDRASPVAGDAGNRDGAHDDTRPAPTFDVRTLDAAPEVGAVTDAGVRVDAGSADAEGDPCAAPGVTCYYLAPTGDDRNRGDMARPFATLDRAWMAVTPGDVVFVRGGTYALARKPVLTGRSGAPGRFIRVWAYPGETPVFRPGPGYVFEEYVGVFFSGDYVHFRGLEFTGFAQAPGSFVASGLRAENASHNVFERLHVHHNGHGMLLHGNSTGNVVLNSDFHHNQDPLTGYGNADGLSVAYLAEGTRNTVRGCRAWNNSDDGFDAFASNGHVTFEDCWSWHNGYVLDTTTTGGDGDGFKLGTTGDHPTALLRTVRGCLAFGNRLSGFHQEEGNSRMEIYNNTSYNNGDAGFHFNYMDRAHALSNNVALSNANHQAILGPASVSRNNAYGGGGANGGWLAAASSADFVTLAPDGVDAPRQADGSLPAIAFLHLAPGSDLANAGVDVGLPYRGSAPDLGAFESR